METIHRDYADRNVQFFYIYKALAHPETNGYITPYTLEERLLHVREAERTLGSAIPWICDTMENDLKHGLGDAPNSEFVIDPDGKVVRRRGWSNPAELRRDLEELVGPVERPTRVEDLQLRREPPPKVAASGVVPRLTVPGRMSPVLVTPVESTSEGEGKIPFYVKLRAEADENLLRQGAGKLYLGFHLDPLYHVHWNNLVAPVKFSIEPVEGLELTPAQGEGPQVEAPADLDPREFLIEVTGASQQPLTIKVDYFACNDEEGWCKPVSQLYTVRLQRDRDGGSVQARNRGGNRPGGPNRPGNPPRPGAGPPQGQPLADGVQRVMGVVGRFDAAQGLLVVRTRMGAEQEVRLADDALVIVDGRRATLNDLQPGQRVLLGLEPAEEGQPRRALRIMARSM